MTRLEELNERRAKAKLNADYLGLTNIHGVYGEERIALDARYQLAMDAWLRAELDYRAELQKTPTGGLLRLAGVSPQP